MGYLVEPQKVEKAYSVNILMKINAQKPSRNGRRMPKFGNL
jgi:hypothetical protein